MENTNESSIYKNINNTTSHVTEKDKHILYNEKSSKILKGQAEVVNRIMMQQQPKGKKTNNDPVNSTEN